MLYTTVELCASVNIVYSSNVLRYKRQYFLLCFLSVVVHLKETKRNIDARVKYVPRVTKKEKMTFGCDNISTPFTF